MSNTPRWDGHVTSALQLAGVIYGEAGADPAGQFGVASVMYNRTQDSRFPSTIKGVVSSDQFIGYDNAPNAHAISLANDLWAGRAPQGGSTGNALVFMSALEGSSWKRPDGVTVDGATGKVSAALITAGNNSIGGNYYSDAWGKPTSSFQLPSYGDGSPPNFSQTDQPVSPGAFANNTSLSQQPNQPVAPNSDTFGVGGPNYPSTPGASSTPDTPASPNSSEGGGGDAPNSSGGGDASGAPPDAAGTSGAFGLTGPNYPTAPATPTATLGTPIARVGDRGSHGAQIITGDPSISTNDRNHARIGDLVNCPIHGVNSIIAARESVVNGDQKAAHVGAVAKCGAQIITGSEDISIGKSNIPTPPSRPNNLTTSPSFTVTDPQNTLKLN